MKLLDRFKANRYKRVKKKFIREIKIQASSPEGGQDPIILESLLTGVRLNLSIPGTTNAFATYDSQVNESYRKYNGYASFGNQQTRAIVDLRTAFIGGEGISITCEDDNTSEWIEDLLDKNKMFGSQFTNAVKGTELAGQALFMLRPKNWKDGSIYIRLQRVPYLTRSPFKPVFRDKTLRDEVADMQVRDQGIWKNLGLNNFVYIRTGGDDASSEGPVTRVGTVLTDIENYDRAIRDMRRNNHIFARITPRFKTQTDKETTALRKQLEDVNWKIGDAFAGKAEFDYVTPGSGAHDNLKTELASTIKTISGVTGVPVHWFGWVDLMSNRATATTLYELIKQATILERQIWQESLYEMIFMAQELFINSGGEGLDRLNPDFQVRLPLIDFSEFLDRVKGLSLAYSDEAISLSDYRNALPGIDPLKTEKMIEQEKSKETEDLTQNPIIPFEEEDNAGQSSNSA